MLHHINKITDWCHHFLQLHIREGANCIDATAGNGNDTLFLCRLVGDTGRVAAFDIQPAAITKTKQLLEKNKIRSRADLYLDSHANLKKYFQHNTVDAIVFNFGYLPGADHKLATQPESSLEAIQQGLDIMVSGGIMTLCIYSGGDTGFEERDIILSYLKQLDAKKYTVILSQYYNRPNNPPIPALIIKQF